MGKDNKEELQNGGLKEQEQEDDPQRGGLAKDLEAICA